MTAKANAVKFLNQADKTVSLILIPLDHLQDPALVLVQDRVQAPGPIQIVPGQVPATDQDLHKPPK